MTLRRLLCLSLLLNILLLLASMLVPSPGQGFPRAKPPLPAANSVETSPVASPRGREKLATKQTLNQPAFNWNEIVSDNPTQMVANLRFVQCPEPTIRLILTAYARERTRSDVSHSAGRAYAAFYEILADCKGNIFNAAKTQQEELEKIGEVIEGIIKAAGEQPPASSGQLLEITEEAAALSDFLEPENARRVAEIQAYYAAEEQKTGNLSREERTNRLALLKTERTEALKLILTPEQLHELELRKHASVKQDYYLLPATREEWNEMMQLYGQTSKTNGHLKGEMLVPLIGPERAQEFERLRDPSYMSLSEITAEAGMPATTAQRAAAIYDELEKDREALEKEPMPESYREALLEQRQNRANQDLKKVLGPEAFEAFQAEQR